MGYKEILHWSMYITDTIILAPIVDKNLTKLKAYTLDLLWQLYEYIFNGESKLFDNFNQIY